MKRSDRKGLYSCSKEGLVRIMNRVNAKDRFSSVVTYIARHGMYGGRTKDDLYDLIYTAKSELLAQEAKIRKEDGFKHDYDKLLVVSNKDQERVKAFLRNPLQAMQKELVDLSKTPIDPNQEDKDVNVYINRLHANSIMLATQINIEKQSQALKYDKNADRTDIMNRIDKKVRRDGSVDKALTRINSGVFGRLFRRPSKEYKDFETAFNFFRDPNSALSGNVEELTTKTNAYLKHLIPDYDPEKIAQKKEEWLNSLPKGQRKRAGFALGVIESVKEHDTMKPIINNLENAAKGKPIDPSVDEGKKDLFPKAQKEFQNQIDIELKEEAVKEEQPVIKEEAKKEEVVKEEQPAAKEKKAEEVEEDLEPII